MTGRPLFLCTLLLTMVAFPTAASAVDYGRLPLSFEVNDGQADPAVRFLSRGRGYTLFLTPSEAVLRLSGPQSESSVVRMQVEGGRQAPRITGLDPLATRSNYLLGNDPSRWRTGVPHYARVRYEAVYPGIDLVYHGSQRQLEYDFVLAPGADPRRIRLAFPGADGIKLGARGELVLRTAQGELVQPPPVVYQQAGQQAGAERQPVEGRYILRDGRVGFAVGRYDRARTLVIDPVLAYSTFLGDGGDDAASRIAVDGAGNAYISGTTDSSLFPGVSAGSIQPVNGGGGDVFVTKINSAGSAILYSTFLGGGARDQAFDMAVDVAGSVYITGDTASTSFPGVGASSIQPTHAGGFNDAFVTKINTAGSAILYSTFLGGSFNDAGYAIAVDGAGNAYVTGLTHSPDFIGVTAGSLQQSNGSGDAFVTKINSAGSAIVYSTYLGSNFEDAGAGIAVDGAGNVYISGSTDCATSIFPGINAGSIQPTYGGGTDDGFVTKINATGTAIVYSTFLGGNSWDQAFAIAVDPEGSAYVTGLSFSTTFPGVGGNSIQPANGSNGSSDDAIVTKINPAGSAIVYSTFLGGGGSDIGADIAIDSAGSAYITGYTDSTAFPGVDGSSIQPVYGGGGLDGFVTKINPTGSAIVYSTFLGGSGVDVALGVAVDLAGSAYVAGRTTSTSFPGVTGGSLQPANGGGSNDAFVTKIREPALAFFTVSPCRLVDTRDPAGPLGGPALQSNEARVFVVTGVCGVPASARALSVNVTVTEPTAAGDQRLLPGDQVLLPLASTINESAGQTRANNAVALLAFDGSGGLKVTNASAGSVHLLLDVNGYFQ